MAPLRDDHHAYHLTDGELIPPGTSTLRLHGCHGDLPVLPDSVRCLVLVESEVALLSLHGVEEIVLQLSRLEITETAEVPRCLTCDRSRFTVTSTASLRQTTLVLDVTSYLMMESWIGSHHLGSLRISGDTETLSGLAASGVIRLPTVSVFHLPERWRGLTPMCTLVVLRESNYRVPHGITAAYLSEPDIYLDETADLETLYVPEHLVGEYQNLYPLVPKWMVSVTSHPTDQPSIQVDGVLMVLGERLEPSSDSSSQRITLSRRLRAMGGMV